jgi:hypothetical protein
MIASAAVLGGEPLRRDGAESTRDNHVFKAHLSHQLS